MPDTPQNIRELIIANHTRGLNYLQIAEALDVTRWTVGRIVRQHLATGRVQARREGRCGRRSPLSQQTRRRLVRYSTANPRLTARQLQQEVGGEALVVHVRTVRRSLRRSGLIPYRPRPSPSLTPAQKLIRHNWARDHLNWTLQQWQRVIFSDETAIEIGAARTHFVRRGRGARMTELHTVGRHQFRIKVLFWGCLTSDGPGDLVAIDGNMNAERYENVLERFVLPRLCAGSIFQQDYAPAHSFRRIQNFIAQHNINQGTRAYETKFSRKNTNFPDQILTF